jgi:hypothetical protein
MDFETQRYYYNRCRPYEVLQPGDPRYAPLDELGDAEHQVRGSGWGAKLARRVELSTGPVCELITGLPGSGKSTELRRLAERFADPAKANLLPVYIDAEQSLDLNNPIDVPDIILAVIYEVGRAVLKAEGKDPDGSASESYPTRLWNWLNRTDVELSRAEFSVPEAGKLVAELQTRPSLRERVRKTVAAHLTTFLKEASDELIGLEARAAKLKRKGLIVILDSMEKLRGISSNYEEVLLSAERVFAGGAPQLRLPVHVLYTLPTALIARRRFERVQFMPMIKLKTRAGEEFEDGFAAARQLVTRRVPLNILEQVLGPQMEARLRRMIAWSGGYPRELVRMLQEAIGASEVFPLSPSQFERVLNQIGDEYSMLVTGQSMAWLALVAVTKDLSLDDDEHRKTADSMLTSNAILRYQNDSAWFDLHPAVRQLSGVQREIDKLERARQAE